MVNLNFEKKNFISPYQLACTVVLVHIIMNLVDRLRFCECRDLVNLLRNTSGSYSSNLIWSKTRLWGYSFWLPLVSSNRSFQFCKIMQGIFNPLCSVHFRLGLFNTPPPLGDISVLSIGIELGLIIKLNRSEKMYQQMSMFDPILSCLMALTINHGVIFFQVF